jgi:HAD superfamily hydrolase (TIGR01509 family)
MFHMIDAVIFDLDGVLLDSEHVWDQIREAYAQEKGGRWHASAQTDMMGMNSREWSHYMHEVIGLRQSAEEISQDVAGRVIAVYQQQLPLLEGAVEAVEQLAKRWGLAVASSSNREVIDVALQLAGLTECFAVTVSSEEVSHGKPQPDVYVEAARQLGVVPMACVAIEDSRNGILSAKAAGMRVIAVPNRRYPPSHEALGVAALVLHSLIQLTPGTIESL